MNNTQQYRQQLALERLAAQTTLGRLATRAGDAADGQQREHLLQKVLRIEAALARLDHDAAFGVCQQCGQAIQPERLALLPYAELCVNCQRQLERQTLGIRRLSPATLPAW